MEIMLGVLFGLVLFAGATFVGGLLYLGAVWLNAHKKSRGPWGRYSDWVMRTADRIENKKRPKAGGRL